jgi:hypothetical protein
MLPNLLFLKFHPETILTQTQVLDVHRMNATVHVRTQTTLENECGDAHHTVHSTASYNFRSDRHLQFAIGNYMWIWVYPIRAIQN